MQLTDSQCAPHGAKTHDAQLHALVQHRVSVKQRQLGLPNTTARATSKPDGLRGGTLVAGEQTEAGSSNAPG